MALDDAVDRPDGWERVNPQATELPLDGNSSPLGVSVFQKAFTDLTYEPFNAL